MMSKEDNEEESAPPAFAVAPPPTALNVGSVADLERRLAEMGTEKKAPPPALAVAPAPVVAKAAAPVVSVAPPSVNGGKNALLARIMAAKEKQEKKMAPPLPPAVAPVDLLTDFDAPPTETELPPPSYETNFLKDVPPPAFDVMENQHQQEFQYQQQQQHQHQQQEFLPPPPIDSVLPPPPPLNDVLPPPPLMPGSDYMTMGSSPSAPTASAPMFEDLHIQQPEFHPPPLPPPMEAAPPQTPAALDIDDSILNALDPAEREAFLEEQRKILEQIENEKSNNQASVAAARATAFDQRSTSAVANVAASYERGQAGWPVENMGAATTADMEAAAQLAADAELAEKLQKEEYAGAEERRSRPRSSNRSQQQQQQQQQQESSGEGKSWYDWLTGTPTPAPATRSTPASTTAASPPRSSGLVSAQTGEEERGYGSRGGEGARMAEPKSMFACVADSINTAATQMYTLSADEEGNVHGVDSQGLLAMPDVSRPREN